MCLALCWKSGCLEERWTRLVVCQEIKWTVCPWLQLHMFLFSERICRKNWTVCLLDQGHPRDKQKDDVSNTNSVMTSWYWSVIATLGNWGFFFLELRHDVFVTVHHSWEYVYVLNACGCVQEQIERGREGEHVCMRGTCVRMFMYCVTPVV